VIARPPLSGATHLIDTDVAVFAVTVGTAGAAATVPGITTADTTETGPVPSAFTAETLNV